LKVLEGNPGHQKLDKAIPMPEPGMPEMPEWLAPDAREEWARMGPGLVRIGVLTPADGQVYASYCTAVATVATAERQLRELERQNGPLAALIQTTHGQIVRSIFSTISRDAQKDALRYAQELGMTPSARCRLEGLQSGEANPFEGLMYGDN